MSYPEACYLGDAGEISAPREGYFEGVAAGLDALTDAERQEFFVRHDTYWI
jgi:hypothetical protein